MDHGVPSDENDEWAESDCGGAGWLAGGRGDDPESVGAGPPESGAAPVFPFFLRRYFGTVSARIRAFRIESFFTVSD